MESVLIFFLKAVFYILVLITDRTGSKYLSPMDPNPKTNLFQNERCIQITESCQGQALDLDPDFYAKTLEPSSAL